MIHTEALDMSAHTNVKILVHDEIRRRIPLDTLVIYSVRTWLSCLLSKQDIRNNNFTDSHVWCQTRALTLGEEHKLQDFILLQLPSAQFVAQIYHTCPFTTFFGLIGRSSGILGFFNHLFLFLLRTEDGPIRPKHVVKGNLWYICATNCVDGN
jgi:hypothetical protein